MDQIESYELSLLIKELRLSVKFPCRLTLQHAGRPVSPEIVSNGSSVFAINRELNIKQDKNKDYLEINVNLATDKGGNIMAGIIKINLKDLSQSEGENLTISLQKCLDPYATCLLTVKSVKINRSRVKKVNHTEDWKPKHLNELKFQSKSEAPVLDIRSFKPRPRYNDTEASGSKKALNSIHSPMNSQLKEKALSVVGFRGVNTSFDRQELASRFKHYGRKEDEDNKTVITGKWKESEHVVKASIEANQKNLKLQILKYKTKFEEGQRNLEEKNKQNKHLKDQLADLNRQLTEKQYLVEELASKNSQISKLQETNKGLSRQLHQERTKIIDLERLIEQEKNSNYMQMSRYKEEHDKKEHEFQKSIYEKREEIKEVMEENHYKNNQINKMKGLIEDLEASLQAKTYEYEKLYNREKNQHNKTKALLQQKIVQLQAQVKKHQQEHHSTSESLKKAQEENAKLQTKIGFLQDSLVESENRAQEEARLRSQLADSKKLQERIQEDLKGKIRSLERELSGKEKEIEDLNIQLSQLSGSSKKKTSELMEKNKGLAIKIQQLENKLNLLTAQEEKLKRNLEINQKETKALQQNQKIAVKNSKLKDERILQLEKQLTEIENKSSIKENLTKKEAEYKAQQLEKMTARVSELQKNYEKEKEIAEERRLEILKTENKVRMLEEACNRLTEQIKDMKAANTKREEDWADKLRELKEQLNSFEAKQKQANRDLHMAEIEKINQKNEIAKLQKTVQTLQEKATRLKKRESELEAAIKNLHGEIDTKNEQIVERQAAYKALQNNFKALQADKSKTDKITTIINEEKVMAVSDINRLKKQLERREQKEQDYQSEIKQLKEEILKLELKWTTVSKDYQKFKASVSESIRNSFSMKNSITTLETSSTGLDLSRMNRARNKTLTDYSITVEANDTKFGQLIEHFARESQQAVVILSQEVRKIKKEKQNLEKDIQSMGSRMRENEQEFQNRVSELTAEIDTITSQNAVEFEDYEDKISVLQKELKRRQKSINEIVQEMEQLKLVQQNELTAHELAISDLVSKINSLKSKLADYQLKDQSNSVMFVTLEEKIAGLETDNTEYIRQNQLLTDQLHKKEKECHRKTEELEDLSYELEGIKKAKADLLGELLSTKESLTVEKQNGKHLLAELKQEQSKNTQLKIFNAELLKEKEMAIKREGQLSAIINDYEQKIQTMMIEIVEKTEETAKKDKSIAQLREDCKNLRMENTNYQSTLSDVNLDVQREREKVKDRERKNAEKDQDIEDLRGQLKKNVSKYEAQVAALTQENESLSETLRKKESDYSIKCNDFELTIRTLRQSEKKLTQANITLQQQIFFEKQLHSLSSGKIDELHHQITNLNIEIDQLKNNISTLNDELREKQESLFALSGKLFTSENRIENREEEFKSRLEKVELDWRYKIEEICEEYENKIEIMEREKSYVKSGMEGCSEAIQKLQSEKASLRQQMDRERQNWEAKLKKAEEQKLVSLIEKNRQIQKIREVFEELEEKLKRRDYQIKALEEDKRKAQEKAREVRTEWEKAEEKHAEAIRSWEREVDQLKRKEGQLKRFKDALKNSQWATEREIKKSIQSCSKTVMGLVVEESKDEAMSLLRNLESSVAKLALPNIDEM